MGLSVALVAAWTVKCASWTYGVLAKFVGEEEAQTFVGGFVVSVLLLVLVTFWVTRGLTS
jgi:hypothetical protein